MDEVKQGIPFGQAVTALAEAFVILAEELEKKGTITRIELAEALSLLPERVKRGSLGKSGEIVIAHIYNALTAKVELDLSKVPGWLAAWIVRPQKNANGSVTIPDAAPYDFDGPHGGILKSCRVRIYEMNPVSGRVAIYGAPYTSGPVILGNDGEADIPTTEPRLLLQRLSGVESCRISVISSEDQNGARHQHEAS